MRGVKGELCCPLKDNGAQLDCKTTTSLLRCAALPAAHPSQVVYDDGEVRSVSITTDRIKWILPPGGIGKAG